MFTLYGCKGTPHFPFIGPSDTLRGPPRWTPRSPITVFVRTFRVPGSRSKRQVRALGPCGMACVTPLGPPDTCQRVIPIRCSSFLLWGSALLPLRPVVDAGLLSAVWACPWACVPRTPDERTSPFPPLGRLTAPKPVPSGPPSMTHSSTHTPVPFHVQVLGRSGSRS